MELIRCKKRNCVACDLPDSKIEQIAGQLKIGKLVVYPTETLYGLGANPFDETAVKRVYMIKNRPFDMPLSIAVRDGSMLEELAVVDDMTRKLIAKFTPGPITILVTKKRNVPDILTSASMEIGVRIPNHPFALRLIEKSGPIVSTSANLHSRPNPTDADTAIKDIGQSVDICVDCGPCRVGKPSTIVQLSEGGLEIIRQGAIPKDEIEAVLNE